MANSIGKKGVNLDNVLHHFYESYYQAHYDLLKPCMSVNFVILFFMSFTDFVSKLTFSKTIFWEDYRNIKWFVKHDLDPNCLYRLSTDAICHH